MPRLCALVLWMLLSPLYVLAADIYFAANGDDLNPCTAYQPCQSLDKARQRIAVAQPGDTFYFRGGDIFDGENEPCIAASNVDGTPDLPITLTTFGVGRAILENCSPVAIRGDRNDWWVVEHLEIRHSTYAIWCLGCQNWLVQHNSMHHLDHVCLSFDSFPRADPAGVPTEGWLVRHNLCYETGLNGHGEGFYFYPGPVADVVLEHNELFNLRDEGVNCKGDNHNIVVRHNYFHDFHPPLAHAPTNRGVISQLAHWVGQWFFRPATAGQNDSEDTGINCRFENDTDIVVERNLIENMPYAGVIFKQLQNAVTQHNLIVGSGSVAIGYTEAATGHIGYNTLYKNHQSYRNEGMIANHDIIWGNTIGNNATDPGFVDAASGDFNLTAHSDRRSVGQGRLSQGVFHSPWLNACAVRRDERNTVRCSVHPIRFSPLRCPEPKALSVAVNGQSRGPASRCRVASDRVLRIDFTGRPVRANDTVKLSAKYGALQDSAWIGGKTPEGACLAGLYACNSLSLAVTNRQVTNRVH